MVRRHFVLVGFVLMVVIAALSPAVVPPARAASCYGLSCNGLDPYAAGCASDAVEIARGYLVWRYYSPSCNAYFAWAGYPQDIAIAWMEANFDATYHEGWNQTYSLMWSYGRACSYYGCV